MNHDLNHANASDALQYVRTWTIERMRLSAQREQQIKLIDERFGPRIAQCEESIAQGETILKQWAEEHPEEFAKRKSLDLVHGTIGWRTTTPKLVKKLKAAWTSAAFIERVRNALGALYIRTIPEINREQIITDRAVIPAEALKEAGLAIEQAEKFFVEPKIDDPT
jgi:phage host-nuclease inhibitor protein Gam